jgi:hypothetical protein
MFDIFFFFFLIIIIYTIVGVRIIGDLGGDVEYDQVIIFFEGK